MGPTRLCAALVRSAFAVSARYSSTATTATTAPSSGSGLGRLYSEQHEWLELDPAERSEAVVGVSAYAQEALGEVVFAQLPEPGAKLSKGQECGALESVKAASEIYSPASGAVLASNDAVSRQPSLINSDCYGGGWLFRLKLRDPDELRGLMTEDQYETFLETAR